jgi:di/tricarboxylate transporter
MTRPSLRRRKALKTLVLGLFATIALLWGAHDLIGIEWYALLRWLGASVLALIFIITCAGLTVFLWLRFVKRRH